MAHATKNRRYACSKCGQRFKRKAQVQDHINSHFGRRPYVCECGASFVRQGNLNQHRLIYAPHKYGCALCGRRYRWKYYDRRHVCKIHAPDRKSVQLPSPTSCGHQSNVSLKTSTPTGVSWISHGSVNASKERSAWQSICAAVDDDIGCSAEAGTDSASSSILAKCAIFGERSKLKQHLQDHILRNHANRAPSATSRRPAAATPRRQLLQMSLHKRHVQPAAKRQRPNMPAGSMAARAHRQASNSQAGIAHSDAIRLTAHREHRSRAVGHPTSPGQTSWHGSSKKATTLASGTTGESIRAGLIQRGASASRSAYSLRPCAIAVRTDAIPETASMITDDGAPSDRAQVLDAASDKNFSASQRLCPDSSQSSRQTLVKAEVVDELEQRVAVLANAIEESSITQTRVEAAVSLLAEMDAWLLAGPNLERLYFHQAAHEFLLADGYISEDRSQNLSEFYMLCFVQDDPAKREAIIAQYLLVEFLPTNYPIKELHGQRGVFARMDIPIDCVLGLFDGMTLKEGCDEDQSRDIRAELDYLNDLPYNRNATAETIDRYAYSMPLYGGYMERGRKVTLIVSALQHGNSLGLVNSWKKGDGRPPESVNVAVVCVRMGHYPPALLVVAVRTIKAGEEILLNYGQPYFDRFRVSRKPVELDPAAIAESRDLRLINRFSRPANNFDAPFRLKLASEAELLSAAGTMVAEKQVQNFELDIVNMCIVVTPAAMTAAVKRQPVLVAET